MNDIQERMNALKEKGWSDAAIAEEIGYGRVTIFRWRSGEQYPDHPKPIVAALNQLLERKRIPKRRRYAPGEHHTQRKSLDAED